MLQNLHLISKWIKRFENDLEKVSQTAHPNFRCFISSEPPVLPTLDILFSLCFFHSLIINRRKFGAIGWSTKYNFNEGDLQICADVLNI